MGATDPRYLFNTDYQAVAASQSGTTLAGQKGVGRAGDVLEGVLCIPATTSPGAVQIADGGGSAITIFAGGASSVADLKPFFIPIGTRSVNGAWKATTGANISIIGVGKFS